MSTAPAPGPRESNPPEPRQKPPQEPRPKPSALVFDDPLDRQSADDTDQGWGERAPAGGASDLARFLDEKPPHHI
ncbi:hypothetical protein B046DRAFT_06329 [Streptomyces sp. LamerLS-316]|uniref:hypothetical protein n=1 Tax=unclassified Streptomyces TaxID=2593676 RepID=UPI000823D2C2|nr:MULTISPECIES: hypothetical protein [unclassified Streptomyces]MYQ43431.1 hypothetical protein [Streptomyces sp. SID4921]SCK20698.1 hypothetical protein B046DRAFT_06329 [Streptomyces sp. LamerLS-316]